MFGESTKKADDGTNIDSNKMFGLSERFEPCQRLHFVFGFAPFAFEFRFGKNAAASNKFNCLFVNPFHAAQIYKQASVGFSVVPS